MKFHLAFFSILISIACDPALAAPATGDAAQGDAPEQVLEAAETHVPYVSEIREGNAIVSELWTGYRIVRRGLTCARIDHELAGMDHYKAAAGTVDLPTLKLTEVPINCPPQPAAGARK